MGLLDDIANFDRIEASIKTQVQAHGHLFLSLAKAHRSMLADEELVNIFKLKLAPFLVGKSVQLLGNKEPPTSIFYKEKGKWMLDTSSDFVAGYTDFWLDEDGKRGSLLVRSNQAVEEFCQLASDGYDPYVLINPGTVLPRSALAHAKKLRGEGEPSICVPMGVESVCLVYGETDYPEMVGNVLRTSKKTDRYLAMCKTELESS